MYQKLEISLPVGTKPRDQKQETGNDGTSFQVLKFRENRFLRHFLIFLKKRTFVPFRGEYISSQQEND